MPLRDLFHPPLSIRHSWDMVHGQWPGTIVRYLFPHLPSNYIAGPNVRLGRDFKVDVASMEPDDPPASSDGGGGLAVWAPPRLTVDADLSDFDEYEVRIYDEDRRRSLVAAVEIVSPRNKDRPEARTAFVGKCAALLREGVSLTIIDLITDRHFNLYAELLEETGRSDPEMGDDPPAIYCASLRPRKLRKRSRLDIWGGPLTVGEPLPTLPLWLDEGVVVPLELEASYEDVCRLLRIA